MSEYVLHEIDFIGSHELSHLNYLIPAIAAERLW